MRVGLVVIAVLVVVVGCSTPAASTSPTSAGGCRGVGTSSLPGACISFASPSQTWTVAEAAAGVAVPYEVIVERPIANVVVSPQDAGGCEGPGPSGLIVFARLGDDSHEYCLCDSGLCPSPPLDPTTIPEGRTRGRFEWTGHEWTGPSDTSNQMGPAFPPGTYTLEVSARGTVDGQPFDVRNHLTVVLTP